MPQTTDTIKLMLIEDCRLVRVGIRSILDEEARFDVVSEVDSGETAIATASQAKPDVVLVDLGLPGMSGVEVMHKLRDLLPKAKFIILTSHEAEEDILAALSAGANAYCIKNISAHRLVQVVVSVNEGATWLDPGIAEVAQKVFMSAYKLQQPANVALREQLTEKETAILELLVQGKTNSEVAQELFISIHTAKFYVSNLLEKLEVEDRVQAAVKAIKEGLV